MNLQHPSAAVAPDVLRRAAGSDRWLGLVRLGVVLVAALAVALLSASIPAYYRQALTLSGPAMRDPNSHALGDPEVVRRALRQFGLSVGFYAGYTTLLGAIFGVVYCTVGGLIL